MAKTSKQKGSLEQVHDEPGAEERFLRGIRKALSTPPRKHAHEPKRGKKPEDQPVGSTKRGPKSKT